jgi:hypothetical protein
MPPITSPLIPMRNEVCDESLLTHVSEMLSWLANSDEHFVNNPAASSRPVVALICGGAILEIIKFTPQNQYFLFRRAHLHHNLYHTGTVCG